MRKLFLIPVMAGILALSAAQAFAQSATVVMRNGDRVQAEILDMGRDYAISVNGQVRRVPLGDVVLLDFAGNGRDISPDELTRANAANGYVVMRNGETFNASLQDFTGKPLIAVFSNGRKTNLSEISRIYTGSVANVAGFPNQPSNTSANPVAPTSGQSAPAHARSVVVPANVMWTNSGINVSRGQRLRFEPSGEVRLSFGSDDVARAGGSSRHNEKAIIGSIPVGALVGRVGNGAPFVIGDAPNAVEINDSGRLFLGVNDDHHADNSGNFVVKVWEP